MALTIVVRSGDAQTPPRITFDAARIVIGRAEGCEVRIPDPSVSHRHASVRQRGTEYIVMDEGSTNGTFVGPVRLMPQTPRMLKHGDLVRVGRVWLEARIEHVPPTQNAPMATKEIALLLVAEGLAAQGEPAAPRLRVTSGPSTGTEVELTEFGRAYVIGRGKGVDLNLDDPDLSRRHVQVQRRGDRILITDLGSKNGSRLAGEPLTPNQETPWPLGALLEAGAHAVSCENPVKEALEELERAADEKIRDEELIDPPTSSAEEPAVAPAPQLAARSRSKPPKARKASAETPTGWSATDFMVALLAIAVFAVSLLGLWWIARQ